LETKYESSLTNLTSDQQAQLAAFNQRLATEQTRFQNFIANHTPSAYAAAPKQLSDRINAFEHQVTYQIDHGTAVTAPDTLAGSSAVAAATNTSTGTTATDTSNTSTGTTTTASNTSTGTTTSNTSTGTTANSSNGTPTVANTSTGTTAGTIAAGFAALEAAASSELSSLPADLLSTVQQQLTTEQARFTAFIARRAAYAAAINPQQTGTAQDVAA
jgi:hypothetical protein